ncbi:MAG: metal-dependent hydrolase, partial [Pseudomonadales bacterium]|nr:metal-dependent hydrolase [Pseudomonadales bacterium]
MHFTKLAPGAPTSNGVTIQPRRFRFKGYDSVPLLWMGDSVWFTQLFNALSILIPEAERFMIKAMRRAVESVDDDALKDECRAFIIQEAHHHKIHDQLNEVLIRQGYSLQGDIRETKRLFKFFGKLPLRFQLAISCALEHLTATLSSLGLSEMDGFFEIGHPKMFDLWQWHGAEELEHKTVMYDLYYKVGGGYLQRVTAAVLTLLIGGFYLFVIHLRLMRQHHRMEDLGHLSDPTKQKSYVRVRYEQMLKRFSKRFFKLLLAYFRPGFHPLDIDDSKALKNWYQITKTLDKDSVTLKQVSSLE